jgi:hypothetical protein
VRAFQNPQGVQDLVAGPFDLACPKGPQWTSLCERVVGLPDIKSTTVQRTSLLHLFISVPK